VKRGITMVKLDVCLETVFTGLPVEERIRRIAGAGYDCVEMWFHDCTFNGTDCAGPAKDFTAIRHTLKDTGVTVNNLVVNSPDGGLGGFLVKKEDREKYLERLKTVMAVAGSIDCKKAITCTGNEVPGLSRAQMKKNTVETLGSAAEIAGRNGFTLLLEPLNTSVDHPGYFLDSAEEGAEIVREIDSPNLMLLYDIYHMQIMEGNLSAFIEKNLDIIGHFHTAGVPGRHEPSDGEINYKFILSLLERLRYVGSFGLEYFPAMADHHASLVSTRKHLTGQG